MLSLEIPDDLREAIRRKAFVENMSVSKMIRQLLEVALKQELEAVRSEDIYGKHKN